MNISLFYVQHCHTEQREVSVFGDFLGFLRPIVVKNDIISEIHAKSVISNRRERSQNDLLVYCRAFAATRAMSYACR